jgi:hypothetical protein
MGLALRSNFGVLEYWSIGFGPVIPITPSLQYSILPGAHIAGV